MKLQLSKSDKEKQFTLARQRQMHDKLRIEEDTLKKEVAKKDRELHKRNRSEQVQQAEERARIEREEEESRRRSLNQGQWNKQMVMTSYA